MPWVSIACYCQLYNMVIRAEKREIIRTSQNLYKIKNISPHRDLNRGPPEWLFEMDHATHPTLLFIFKNGLEVSEDFGELRGISDYSVGFLRVLARDL